MRWLSRGEYHGIFKYEFSFRWFRSACSKRTGEDIHLSQSHHKIPPRMLFDEITLKEEKSNENN